MKSWLKRKILKNARNGRLTHIGIYAYNFAGGIFYRCPFWLVRKKDIDKSGALYSAWQFNEGGYWFAYDGTKCGYRKIAKVR